MQFVATFTPVKPEEQVTLRTLVVTDAQGTREIPLAPEALSALFESEPSPGNFGTVELYDTNVSGKGAVSNTITYDLTPPPPPPIPVPTAPTLLTVSPVNAVASTKIFKR